MSNRFVIYCRKSTDEKDKQVLSIESQLAELREFAHRERLEVVGEYTEAKTAKSPGRPVFKQVVGLIESGSANAILSWAPDRLARNSIDGGYLIYLLDTGKLGDLKFPSFWFENTPQGKFMLNIAFGQSKYYVDNLSENVKRGNRQKLRNGIWPNCAPYGYKNDRETKSIAIVPEKARIVRSMFATFANQSVSYTNIARLMTKAGFARRTGSPIRVDQVKHMLANPFYIGILKYGGELYEGKHATFVPKSLFTKVQAKLNKLDRPQYGKHKFAFSGLMRCGECGATITSENHTKHYKRRNVDCSYTYYRCTKKLKPCKQLYVSEPVLADQFRELARMVALPKDWGTQWLEWLERDEKQLQDSAHEQVNDHNTKLTELQTKLDRLLDGYLDGSIDHETYKSKKNDLFLQKKVVEDKIAKINSSGSASLEPMRDFIMSALSAHKIARKNTANETLASFIKNIDSNYFLRNQQLVYELKKPFASLRAAGLARAMTPAHLQNSLSVTPSGFEPELTG